jgi:hypothetical protein
MPSKLLDAPWQRINREIDENFRAIYFNGRRVRYSRSNEWAKKAPPM